MTARISQIPGKARGHRRPASLAVHASTNTLENERYLVRIDANGDINSISDKKLQRDLLNSPIRLELLDWRLLLITSAAIHQRHRDCTGAVSRPPARDGAEPCSIPSLEIPDLRDPWFGLWRVCSGSVCVYQGRGS